ncbi:PREDICTED: trypsin 3A1-like [Papilio xuthus]|uniref:Trypsin 3A1-like n=1 Tax=Papilio xuthus TaxID=66420 RepID=A0AAJ6YYK1_PAPXU|nr:PREDICTED: trypsin 3A1-like [Papilio xuthus]
MMCPMLRFIFISLACLGLSVATDIILSERVPTNGKFTEVAKESDTNEERIVGGRNATCEEFPHQVSFVVNNSYFCGGFIISDQYILTAAHCAQEVDPSTVVMRIGSTWRKNGTKVTVTEVIPYPEYNNPPYDKDIAVMKIAEPLQFDACTQPIALPPKGLSASYGEVITVSGWGRTKQGVTMIPDRLMAVNLTVVNHTLCRAAYLPLSITENMLCAGNFFLGGQSTCQGDSGGIGAINNVARGIVSFGRGCGQPLAPSVFTDISAPDMRDFITKHTGL